MVKRKSPEERSVRRLYSLYAEQVRKLAELAAQSRMSQSEYLRQLIDVQYVEKLQKERKRYVSVQCAA